MERVSHEQVKRQQQEQNLYGARLFLSGEHNPADVEQYIATQEKTHLAEGLELQQRSIRTLDYVEGKVRGFGGQVMTDVNQAGFRTAQKQYAAGDKAAWGLVRRRQHDSAISERYDQLMAHGRIGDGFMVVSPYEEEQTDEIAQGLGFWPQFRRSYAWFYRKKSEHELECVDLSLDQSSVAAYKQLLGELGVSVPAEVQSYDMPAYAVPFRVESDDERDELIANVKGRYRALNNDPVAKEATDEFEAVEFLEKHAQHYIDLLVDVHRAIAETLASGNLHQLVRLSSSRALKELSCLNRRERKALEDLHTSPAITTDHMFALSTLVTAQRYGIWQSISKRVGSGGEQTVAPAIRDGMVGVLHTAALLNEIYGGTNEAAIQHKTMPGCAGGTSFLQQNESEVKSSIFNGEKYSFDKKMYCVVCQAPPKEDAKPKWCGPCGICRPCDGHLKAKNARFSLAS